LKLDTPTPENFPGAEQFAQELAAARRSLLAMLPQERGSNQTPPDAAVVEPAQPDEGAKQ